MLLTTSIHKLQYDYTIDDLLYKELDLAHKYDSQRVGFNRTLKKINNLRTSEMKKPITVRTFKIHLEKMKSQGIIATTLRPLPGHKGHYQFTEKAIITRKLGIFEGVQSKRNNRYSMEESKTKALRKLIILLFTLGSTGSTRLRQTLKAQPGDIAVRNALTGKLESFEVYNTSGVSIEDITKSKNADYRRKFVPENITEEEIQSLIVTLGETTSQESDEIKALGSDFPILIPDSLRKEEIIYKVKDDKIKKFFTICQEILGYAIWRMELTWTFIRLRHRTDEVRWYNSLVGRKNTISFFEDDRHKMRAQIGVNKAKNSKILEEEKKRRIKVIDTLIASRFHELDQDTEYIKKKLGYLYKFTIDIAYPNFLNKLHKEKKI